MVLRVVLAAALVGAAAGGTTCTRCQEDFSGFMTRRGAGGGVIIAPQSVNVRNEPASGWRIDWPVGRIANGFPVWTWDASVGGGGALALNVFLPQTGLNARSSGTWGTRAPAAVPAAGSTPGRGACTGSVEGTYYVAERWGLVANAIDELAVDFAAYDLGSPIVGLVLNWLDTNNFVAVVQRNSGGEACTGVFRVRAGVVTSLGSVSGVTFTNSTKPTQVWNRLHVSRSGSDLRVWMNNNPSNVVLAVTDPSPVMAPGAVGVFAAGVNGALFDNLLLREAPSCTDGVQNGEEEGIDCGGACAAACANTIETTTLWPPASGAADSHFTGWHRETYGSVNGAPRWEILRDAASADNGALQQLSNVGDVFVGSTGSNTAMWLAGSILLCNKCGTAVDQEIEIDIKCADNDFVGPVVRHTDRDNHYNMVTRIETPGASIHRRRGGRNVVLRTTSAKTYALNVWWRIRMRIVGNRLSIWWDDALWADIWDESDPMLLPGYAGILTTIQEGVAFKRARVINWRAINTVCMLAFPFVSANASNALVIHNDANKATTYAVTEGLAVNHMRTNTPSGLSWYASPSYTSNYNVPLTTSTTRGSALNFNRGSYAASLFAFPRYEADIDADGVTIMVAMSTPVVSNEGVIMTRGVTRGLPGWRLSVLPTSPPRVAFRVLSTGPDSGALLTHTLTASEVTVLAVLVAPLPGDPLGRFNVSGLANGVPWNGNRTDTLFNGVAGLGKSHYLYMGTDEQEGLDTRFIGNVHEVAVWSRALAPSDFANASAYLVDKLGTGLTCSAMAPPNTVRVSGTCVGAPRGASCVMACLPGYRLTSGSLSMSCSGGKWSGNTPYCEPFCGALTAVNTAKSGCVRGLFGDEFESNSTLIRWAAVPPQPFPWFTLGGVLTSPVSTVCGDPVRAVTALVVNGPYWSTQLYQQVRVTTAVRLENVAYIYPRWINSRNLYQVVLDAQYSAQRFEVISNGAVTTLCSSSVPPTPQRTWFVFDILMDANGTIIIARDGAVTCRTQTAVLPYGTAGVGKQGLSRAEFAYFNVDVVERACPNGCLNMTSGASCTLTCDPGMTPIAGNVTRVCGAGGNYSGTPLVCGFAAPQFPSLSASIAENSPAGTLVATANATLRPGMTGTILYEIVDGNNGTAFSIEPCSGALRVATPSMLDYEQLAGGLRYFLLSLRAYLPGITPPAESFANASITILNANDPPRLVTTSCSVPENAGPGALVCTLVAFDEDVPPQPFGFLITYASSNGESAFALNVATGDLTVKAAGQLDFETIPTYTLTVRVRDATNVTLFSEGVLFISVTDVNEPPVITSQGTYEVDSSAVTPGGLIGGPLSATDPDAESVIIFSLGASTSSRVALSEDNMLSFTSGRDYSATTPYERDGRLIVDYLEVVVYARDNSTPPLSTSATVRVYVLANVTGGSVPVIRAMEVRSANSASGSGSMLVTGAGSSSSLVRHLVATSGEDSVYLACSGLTDRYADEFTAVANGTSPDGTPLWWNTTCTVSLTATGVPSTDGYLVCPTGAGWGMGWSLRVSLRVGTTVVRVLSSILTNFDYAPPIVNTISAESATGSSGPPTVDTAGGSVVVVSGFNLGGNAAPFAAVYGPCNATSGACNFRFAFTRVSGTHTSLRLLAAPGVGADLRLRLTVGGQTVEPSAVTVAYSPPTIASVYRPDTNDTVWQFSGGGGELLYITGTQFGSFGGQPEDRPRLSYGPTTLPADAPLPLPFQSVASCTYPVPGQSHTLIACRTAPGLGTNHTLVLSVGGQYGARTDAGNTTAPLTIGYAPPRILSVSGAGSRELDTKGGQVLTVGIANGGPGWASGDGASAVFPAPALTYGIDNSTTDFAASRCDTSGSGIGSTGSGDASVGSASAVACVTGEGSGGVGGLLFAITMGGQTSEPFRSSSRYGPPIVTGFDLSTPGASEADTAGFAPVTIFGRNFGPANASLSVSYSAKATFDGRETVLTFTPPLPCEKPVADPVTKIEHEQLTCLTAPGAGAPLSWSITVTGQTSSQPTTSYGEPSITGVALEAAPYSSPVTDARSDPPLTAVRITGQNFGPPSSPFRRDNGSLVQWIELGPPEAAVRLVDFTVVSHTAIVATLPPGIGRRLGLRISVADQVSAYSSGNENATVSYALPTVTRVTPARSDTRGGVTVRIRGSAWGLLDTSLDHAVSVGGRDVAITERFPSLLAVTQGNLSATAANPANHYIAFEAPQYAGANLPVVVTVFRRSAPSMRVSSDPLADGAAATFTYNGPAILYVTVQAATDPDVVALLNATYGPGFDASAVRVLTIACTNAGPSASLGRIEAQRVNDTTGAGAGGAGSTEGSPWEMGLVTPLPGQWTHDRIVAVSLLARGAVRLVIPVYTLAGTEDAPLASNAASFSDLSPVVVDLTGAVTGNFSTAGGEVVSIGVTNLLSAGVTVHVTIGGAQAALLDGAGAVVAPERVVPDIIAPQLAANPGYDPATFVVRLRLRVPPGQGAAAPIVVYRDGTPGTSVSGIAARYAPPALSGVAVSDADNATVTTSPLPPSFIVRVPTEGGTLRLAGTNLGTCPVVRFGLARGAACAADSTPEDTLVVLSRSHTEVVVAVPAGEGAGNAYGGWRVELRAGDQAAALPGAYRTPTVTRIIGLGDSGLPTRGGVAIQLIGTDFGRAEGPVPDVRVMLNGTYGAPCTGATRDAVAPHRRLTCVLPAGSGGNLSVAVAVGDQEGVSARVLSYDPPRLASVGTLANATDAPPPAWAPGGDVPPLAAFTGAATGPTRGGYLVAVRGVNFGGRDPTAHCLFVAPTKAKGGLLCNGATDGFAEGELPAAAIVSWDHEGVVFAMPPSHGGVAYVTAVVRGQVSAPMAPPAPAPANATDGSSPSPSPSPTASADVWTFTRPSITRVDPSSFDTEGRELVTLHGDNFGFGTTAADNTRRTAASFVPLGFPAPLPLPGDGAGFPSGVALRVNFFSSARCISSAVSDEANTRPAAVSRCRSELDTEGRTTTSSDGVPAGYGVVEHSHTLLKFVSLAGVGVNRTLSVTLVNADGEELTSDTRLVSYAPPTVERIAPGQVGLREGALDGIGRLDFTPPAIVAYGRNYGGADTSSWSEEERRLEMHIDGAACGSPVRLQTPTAVGIQCLFGSELAGLSGAAAVGATYNLTIGYRSVTVRVAGQTSPPSHPTLLQFTCDNGHYALPGETCLACPAGATCAGYEPTKARLPGTRFVNRTAPDGTTYAECLGCYAQPVATPGWFNMKGLVNKDGVSESICHAQRVREGRAPLACDYIVRCEPPEACLAGNACSEGYASTTWPYRCAQCARGFYRTAGVCKKCPDVPELAIVAFVVVVIFAIGAAYWLNKANVNLAFISIGLDFMQVVSIFAQTKIDWPPQMLEAFRVLSAFNLNIDVLSLECTMASVTYKEKWALIEVLPVAMAALLLCIHFAYVAWAVLVLGQRWKHANSKTAPMVSMMQTVMYVLYLYVARTTFDIFTCRSTVPPDYDQSGREKQYMAGIFEQCGVPGGTQMTLLPWAIIALLVYVVGYPSAVGWNLFSHRQLVMEDQLLRAKGVGDDKLTNPHAYSFRRKFSRVYYQFKPGYFFWIEAILLRKFLIAISALAFQQNASFQLAAMLLVLFGAFAAQVRNVPYMTASNYEAVLAEHAAMVRKGNQLHVRLEATLCHIAERGRKRSRPVSLGGVAADLAALRSLTVGQVLHATFGYLVDANTVESVLLAAAMLLCVFGILFAATANTIGAGASSFYAGSRDGVLALSLAVIILSILYWIFVVVVDIYTNITERARSRALARAASKKHITPIGAAGKQGSKRGLERPTSGLSGTDAAAMLQKLEATDSSVNPLFVSADGSGAGGIVLPPGPIDPEVLAHMARPPDAGTWTAVRDAYLAALAANEQMAALLAAADSASTLHSAASRDALHAGRSERTAFQPVSSAAAAGAPPAGGAGSAGSGGPPSVGGFHAARSPVTSEPDRRFAAASPYRAAGGAGSSRALMKHNE